MPTRRRPTRRHLIRGCRAVGPACGLAVVLLLGALAGPVRAEEPPPAAGSTAPTPTDLARKAAIERLARSLRKDAGSPRAEKLRAEIEKDLESLEALGGPDAGKAALEALAFDDAAVEQRVLAFVEAVEDKKPLVKPLIAVLEQREFRRRFRLHAALARTLAVCADPAAIAPLTTLIGSEDAPVVAAAADALVTFKSAPQKQRLEPVRRMIDCFESTWNLKESRRPEDRIARDRAMSDWEVYGAALRRSLQALTGQTQLTRPRQFREWWNDHKKATNW